MTLLPGSIMAMAPALTRWAVIGRDVDDDDGNMIGSASEVYLDDDTGQPEWITVRAGPFGTKRSFALIRDAHRADEAVRFHVDRNSVKDAPETHAAGHLSPEEERELCRYCGMAARAAGPARRVVPSSAAAVRRSVMPGLPIVATPAPGPRSPHSDLRGAGGPPRRRARPPPGAGSRRG